MGDQAGPDPDRFRLSVSNLSLADLIEPLEDGFTDRSRHEGAGQQQELLRASHAHVQHAAPLGSFAFRLFRLHPQIAERLMRT